MITTAFYDDAKCAKIFLYLKSAEKMKKATACTNQSGSFQCFFDIETFFIFLCNYLMDNH
jgi:hypothetical protein